MKAGAVAVATCHGLLKNRSLTVAAPLRVQRVYSGRDRQML